MEFFAESTVKGRKEHCCDACRKPIEVGIVHSYMRMKYDGDFSAVRNHMECREAECDLAKQAGVWGPEDWLFLHDLEREDAEWVKAKHPIAWSRIADRYAYLDEEDQPMTNEPEPNTRAGEAFDPPCTDCGDTGVTFQTERACTCDAATRPLPQPSELVERLERHQSNLCRAICPHYTEQNWPHDPDCQTVSDAIAQLAKLQADGNKLAGALEAFQRHYDLNDCDERCGALEVPISDLRRARQALTEWKDRA